MLSSSTHGDGHNSNNSEDDSSSGKRSARGQSAAPSTSSDDGVGADGLSKSLSSANAMLHKCEACNKVYRHPSCLIKHRWEHTIYWKEASKFLMSKHQQVQLLEAAAILVGMDNNARSLPEEKALWPAAVSPPSSGLLGSDRINFEKLMAQKGQYRGASREPPSPFLNGNTPSSRYTPLPSTTPQSLPYRPSNGSLPSPLDALTSLNISTPRMRGGMHNGDVQHLQLDESAERTDRSGSADTEDDDHDPDTPPDHSLSDERERSDLGAGIEIEMDMDE
ncbi:zinc finger protein [Ceraceosorus bombacis]|nr:zinc finger protein [Ceraceosorus bombacis]